MPPLNSKRKGKNATLVSSSLQPFIRIYVHGFQFMSIVRKVKAVERIFNELEEEINNFKSLTNLHCLSGCGKCCTKPDIEASPLEFLPLAFEWFKAGVAHQKLWKRTKFCKTARIIV